MRHDPTRFSTKKILVVTAHPDDETFGMGGTLAFYGHQGAEVHLVCATRGEAGEVPSEMLTEGQTIAELRQQELECAVKTLGIEKLYFLGYRDSGMTGSPDNQHPNAFIKAPVEKVAEDLVYIIRKIRPEILITFDPNGGYFHPDHIAAHHAAVRAFDLASNTAFDGQGLKPFKPEKLYFHIIPQTFTRFLVKMMPLFGVDPTRFGKNKDIDLTKIASTIFPIHAKINYRKYLKIREQASACHASQGGDRHSGFFLTWLLRLFQAKEVYMRAYPEVSDRNIERDLFSGIR